MVRQLIIIFTSCSVTSIKIFSNVYEHEPAITCLKHFQNRLSCFLRYILIYLSQFCVIECVWKYDS
jgi:hypothetical protein